MTVQNFVKIVWTVFEKFEIFMKRSGEKKTKKKQHDCISSRKFFPTPKNSEIAQYFRIFVSLVKRNLLRIENCNIRILVKRNLLRIQVDVK